MRGLDPSGATGGAPWWRRRYASSSDNEGSLGVTAGMLGGLNNSPAPSLIRGLDPAGSTGGATVFGWRGNCSFATKQSETVESARGDFGAAMAEALAFVWAPTTAN